MSINYALKEGYLRKIKRDVALVEVEIKEAEYDLDKARQTFEIRDYKWAIVKAYYAIFHAARAALYNVGLREKKHFAVGIVLEELAKQGKLEIKYFHDFEASKDTREDADYRRVYSRDRANLCIMRAEEFLERMKRLVNKGDA